LKGIYILLIQLSRDVDANIGALGTRHLAKGFYAYVGSAQVNLENRISRHFRKEKRKFWHIDHLLDSQAAKIQKVLFKEAAKTEECAIATEISRLGEPVVGFGCSDCRCKSHLFYIEKPDFLPKDMTELEINIFSSSAVS
jgi:Uri superfamily endonuclease